MLNFTVLLETLKKNGGFTLSPSGQFYSGKGFAVSLPNNETILPVKSLTVDSLSSIILNLSKAISKEGKDNLFIGAWIDTNTDSVFFDVSEIVSTFEEAKQLGQVRKQLAVFSFESFSAFPIVSEESLQSSIGFRSHLAFRKLEDLHIDSETAQTIVDNVSEYDVIETLEAIVYNLKELKEAKEYLSRLTGE